jgi:Protein of unknown function (DUF2490)
MAQSLLVVHTSRSRVARRYTRNQNFTEEWALWFVLSICCLCSLRLARAQSMPAELPHRDQQAWPELDIFLKAGNRLDLTLISQARLNSGLPNPEIWVVGVDANANVYRHLLITPSYYYYKFDQASGPMGHGCNAVLAATIEETVRAFRLDDRSRIVAVLSPANNFWVYGNRGRVERGIRSENSRDFLFGWDELFYFSNTAAWQRNRVAVGFHKALSERIAVEPYYLHQTDGHSRPGNLNTFGIIFDVRAR